jgi:DNA-binding GntR family transcriptional regulator
MSELAVGLERRGPTPLWEQVARSFRERILSGEWPAHMKLDAEPELARRLGISRGTLRRALRPLIEEGLLVQAQGRGTFVSSTREIEPPIAERMLSLAEALERRGVAFTTQVCSVEPVVPPPRIAALLTLPPGARTIRLVRRRAVAGSTIALLVNYVRCDLCPGIETKDFGSRTLFGVVERDYGLRIEWGRRTFEAQAAPPEVAVMLEIPPGSPVIYIEQVAYLGGGVPVEYSDVWIRGDRVRLSWLLERPRDATEVEIRTGPGF